MDPSSPTTSYEQGQTWLIERQNSVHRDLSALSSGAGATSQGGAFVVPSSSTRSLNSAAYNHVAPPINPIPLMMRPLSNSANDQAVFLMRKNSGSYGSFGTATTQGSQQKVRTIRFQVVVWNIGKLDVVAGTVPMTFRVSLFWNCVEDENNPEDDVTLGDGGLSVQSSSIHVWKMQGRQRAFQQELRDVPTKAIDVPPLSIMNVSTFSVIGSPDVGMLNEETKLMRWSCMYRSCVIQENLRVDKFPHDSHDIHLKLAILSHRGKGKIWDRRCWKLGLATVEDTQHSTRIPHGLIVDQAHIPGFRHNRERGLDFEFCRLDHGIFDMHAPGESTDRYLKVSLKILRESGYYDNNIVPILALMNVVAISVLTFDDTEFFYRALITLNIAFVQMGMRMTTDNHLPMVEYEIRLQRILNEFFVVLMMLVLEAMVVYVLRTYYNFLPYWTKTLDWITGILAVLHNFRLTMGYYNSKRLAKKGLQNGWVPNNSKIA